MTPYYYVYRPGNGLPTHRHPTLAEAQVESERLANKNPGIIFEILKCVAVSQIVKPACTTFFMDGEMPEAKRSPTF